MAPALRASVSVMLKRLWFLVQFGGKAAAADEGRAGEGSGKHEGGREGEKREREGVEVSGRGSGSYMVPGGPYLPACAPRPTPALVPEWLS